MHLQPGPGAHGPAEPMRRLRMRRSPLFRKAAATPQPLNPTPCTFNQGRVLMCPPSGCAASGCVGHRFADKQPLACGVDTANADVGTTFTLNFAVYNTAGLEASRPCPPLGEAGFWAEGLGFKVWGLGF